MNEVINVPEGWEVKVLSKLATVNMGQSPDSEFVNEEQSGLAFLQGNAEFGDVNPQELYWVTVPKKKAKMDDILISVRAPVGDMNIADKEYCIGRGLAALTVNKINQKFGFFSLSYEKKQLDRLAQGSTFLAISKNDFDKLFIKYPKEKKEQEKIAKILSTLDTAIESTQKLINKEKNIKKGLMSDLLQNGIDKNGKIRTPQTHKYKDSELGLISEEWEIEIFSKIASINMGQSPESVFVNENQIGYPFLQGNAEFGDIHPMEEFWTPEPKKLSKIDDILISVRAPVGDINLSDKIYCIGRGLASITIKNIDLDFGYYSLINEKHQLNRLAQGSTFLAISKSDFDRLLIKVPKLKNEQKQIAKILNKQDEKIEKEEENLAKLKEIKKGLMNDLLSGKVRVKL